MKKTSNNFVFLFCIFFLMDKKRNELHLYFILKSLLLVELINQLIYNPFFINKNIKGKYESNY